MSTETPQTTQQEQGEWMLAYLHQDNQYYILTRSNAAFIRAKTKSATALTQAARDPSRVLNVSAYPGVVNALQRGLHPGALSCGFSGQADDDQVCCCGKPKAYHWKVKARAALAAIHPAEGHKT